MKILLVDDEPLARDRLLRLLQKLKPDAHFLEADNGERALEIVDHEDPDLLLLDIRMPGMDGIEVAGHLQQMAQPPAVIFCTAYDQYALEALRSQAMAYLVKPVRETELAAALAAAARVNRMQLAALRGDSGRSRVASHTHRGLETLPVTEIRCFLAEKKYVTAYSDQRELLLPDTLKDLELEFAGRFIRVHRNALVSTAHIEELQKDPNGNWLLVLAGTSVRPVVSRRHVSEVKALLTRG